MRELSETTGLTLNDSLDDEVEYDSMGIEVPGGQTKGSSGASNASLNQNILSKLIKEKSIAIMSME